jgi:hypothetical protein
LSAAVSVSTSLVVPDQGSDTEIATDPSANFRIVKAFHSLNLVITQPPSTNLPLENRQSEVEPRASSTHRKEQLLDGCSLHFVGSQQDLTARPSISLPV